MKRAAVLIGVDKTGGLPKLADAAKGARRMEQWAKRQGIDTVKVFTDQAAAVDASDIKKAIREIVDAGNVEQLLIYFAGHGVNIQRNEYWLLSDAPRDSNAAVNVPASAKLAEDSGIPHVVFISDACRTAAQGTQGQSVQGSLIFPNDSPAGASMAVDQFFACLLGDPAHEVKDPKVPASEYTALYTGALLEALDGSRAEVYEWPPSTSNGLLRPWPLKKYLAAEMPQRIQNLKLQTSVIQVPDAKITSDPTLAWISELAGGMPRAPITTAPPPLDVPPTTAATVAASIVRTAISNPNTLGAEIASARAAKVFGAIGLISSVERTAQPFGPTHHETQCGFKIRGARIVEVFPKEVDARHPSEMKAGDDVRVDTHGTSGGSVLLVLDNGTGVVLPAINGFLGALTVEDGELIDVAYEPSENTWRWGEFGARHEELRALRAVAASATRGGVFRLDGIDALALAKRMQSSKTIDPTFAVYAAYAYSDLRRRDLIQEMSGYMATDLHARFFDIALLAREIDGAKTGADPTVFGFAPLLAQGWALLPAYRVSLPPSLEGLQEMLAPSVWTMFNAQGVERVRNAIGKGEVR
jgi:hypothetical protein